MTRGLVVGPLTDQQVVNRLLYLAGELTIDKLDPYVRKEGAPLYCPTIYYRLPDHNGGTDPTAPDPSSRWNAPMADKDGDGKPDGFINAVTCDCTGAQNWAQGNDRYQPVRAKHVGGWLGTSAMIADALGKQKCYRVLDRPERGCIIVCKKGSRGHPNAGHAGGVVGYRLAEWDPTDRNCWLAIDVVDVAGSRPTRANQRTTGRGWFNTGALFIRSIMTP